MSGAAITAFSAVRTEGGLFPADFLVKVLARDDQELPDADDASYHLPKGERRGEVINRSWARMRGLWEKFDRERRELAETESGARLTRESLLLPLFAELGYGRLQSAAEEERAIDGAVYPLSHMWQRSPIHLLGCNTDLDRRSAGVRGAAKASPHAMVQDYLNRSEKHLWGFCSNGLVFRILRDNLNFSRQAYVEFDLEAMFTGELFADFALLWLLCHQSRVEAENGNPEACPLERWLREAKAQGVRALETLRGSVEKAIEHLGRGFLQAAANKSLHGKLRSGELTMEGYFHQLLRLVYRLLFLFAAEDRGLLHPPTADGDARRLYASGYSVTRLRGLAGSIVGSAHPDLYEGLKIVMRSLSGEEGCPTLGLPALGSLLWSTDTLPDLAEATLANEHLLAAARELAFTSRAGLLRPVDYRGIGAAELGSIYESLLELRPVLDGKDNFVFADAQSGNERKTTGSYYTPTPLIESLLDSALEPVIKTALRQDDPQAALLDLNICDPACGSGHFLLAAARRLARHLAILRSGDAEPTPEAQREALRLVVARCIYGVDSNPMAVELCKVGLWLETLEPGRPLSFLDHHIRCGNSLFGASPDLIAGGLPDAAFAPLVGDDHEVCAELRKRNSRFCQELADGQSLWTADLAQRQRSLSETAHGVNALPDDTLSAIRRKEREHGAFERTKNFRRARLLADAWCAAFVMRRFLPKPAVPVFGETPQPFGMTFEEIRDIAANREPTPALAEETAAMAAQYQFFHWHLAFPEVFAQGGFDVILGNPPWERVKLQEKEWFASRVPEIAAAPNAAARGRLINKLRDDDPAMYAAYLEALRHADGQSHFMRNSGRFPLCGRGDINLYTVFAETACSLLNDQGRMGIIVPSGIASDDTTKFFFQDLVDRKSLVSIFDFENRKKLFQDVDSRMKFCLLTCRNGAEPLAPEAEFVFFAHGVDELGDPERRFTLSPQDLAQINPNTRTCPIFRSRRDAELTKAIYRRVPVLIREPGEGRPAENPWGIKFATMFHMSNDSGRFRTREQLESAGWHLEGNVFRNKEGGEFLPLYEAKMTQMYNHRAADVVKSATAQHRQAQPSTITEGELKDPSRCAIPMSWITKQECMESIKSYWDKKWFLGFTLVTSPTNTRTMNPSLFPLSGVGNSLPIILGNEFSQSYEYLYANLCSYVFDYITRQKIGGVNLNFYIVNQLAVLIPKSFMSIAVWESNLPIQKWILPRVIELTYTAWDLSHFAQDCGVAGPPFRWDSERRFLLRCELDAAFFHLYLPARPDGTWQQAQGETAAQLKDLTEAFPTPRHAVVHIMDSFYGIQEKDVAAHGEYRTKCVILEIYDAMLHAQATGQPYPTRLDPPPADARCRHAE